MGSVDIIINTTSFILPCNENTAKTICAHIYGYLGTYLLSKCNAIRIHQYVTIIINMLNENITRIIKSVINPGNKSATVPIFDSYWIFLPTRKICNNGSGLTPNIITIFINLMGKNISHSISGIRPNKNSRAITSRAYSSVPLNVHPLSDRSCHINISDTSVYSYK